MASEHLSVIFGQCYRLTFMHSMCDCAAATCAAVSPCLAVVSCDRSV